MTHRLGFGAAALMLLLCIWQVQTAAIICGDSDSDGHNKASETSTTAPIVPTNSSAMNQLLHNVQCTLERAKPWIEDLEKEAKRLEETAKDVGLRIIHRFSDLMSTLLGAATRPIKEEKITTQLTHTTIAAVQLDSEPEAPSVSNFSAANDVENEIYNVAAYPK